MTMSKTALELGLELCRNGCLLGAPGVYFSSLEGRASLLRARRDKAQLRLRLARWMFLAGASAQLLLWVW